MNWETKNLEDVVLLQRGFDLPSDLRVQGDVPVISAGQVQGTHNEAKVKGPGFAIGRITNLGQPQWSDVDFWPLNTTLYAKDFKGNDPKWLFYLFKVLDLSGYDSGTVQPALNRNYIAKVPISVPGIAEQRAIADVLGAFDDKIAVNQRVQEIGLELFKLLWQKAQYKASAEVLMGDVIDVNPRTKLNAENGVPFLDMKNLPEDGGLPCFWEVKEAKSGSKFKNGDTLLGRITPCFENRKLGYVDFLDEEEIGLGSTEFIVLRPKEGTPSAVPLCIALSENFRSEAQLNMVGTSGRQRVPAEFVRQFPIRWPSSESLKKYSQVTAPLLSDFSLLVKESRSLARTRDELLPLLMSGKISVADAEDSVSEFGVEKHVKGDGDV